MGRKAVARGMGDRHRGIRHAGAEESRLFEPAVVEGRAESFRVLGRSVRTRLALVAGTPAAICVGPHPPLRGTLSRTRERDLDRRPSPRAAGRGWPKAG